MNLTKGGDFQLATSGDRNLAIDKQMKAFQQKQGRKH
jgi:hypothetical protein